MYKRYLLSLLFFLGSFSSAFAIAGQFDISASTGLISPGTIGYMQKNMTGFVGTFDTVVVHVAPEVSGHRLYGNLYKCWTNCNDLATFSATTYATTTLMGASGTASDYSLVFDTLIQSTSTSQIFILQIYDATDTSKKLNIYGTSNPTLSQTCVYSSTASPVNCPNVREMFWSISDVNLENVPIVTNYFPVFGGSYHNNYALFNLDYFVPSGTAYDTMRVELFHDSIYAVQSWDTAISAGIGYFTESSNAFGFGDYFYRVKFYDSGGSLDPVIYGPIYFSLYGGATASTTEATTTSIFTPLTFYDQNLPDFMRYGTSSNPTFIYTIGANLLNVVMNPLVTISRVFSDRFVTSDATSTGAELASSTIRFLGYVFAVQYIFTQSNPIGIALIVVWILIIVTILVSMIRYIIRSLTLR